MRTHLLCAAAAAQLLAAVAVAQTPDASGKRTPAPPAATSEAKLHSLQLLMTETVFTRQPLGTPATPTDPQQKPGAPAPGAGSSADKAFAVVRDAMFEPSGRLSSLIVEATSGEAGRTAGGGARMLPAKSVQWDEATKRWVLAELTLQFAELPEHAAPNAPPAKEANAPAAAQRGVLASELLAAKVTGFTAPAAGAVEASAPKSGTKQRVVYWLSPVHQQLAFAVVAHGDKFLPLPWALLRTSGKGEATEIRIQASPGAAEGAPTVASAMEQPSAAVRQDSYKHYNVEAPKWESTPEGAARPADKGKSEERKNER